MKRIRVFELSKQLNMTSKELLSQLERLNIPVNSHMSPVEMEDVKKIKQRFFASPSNTEFKLSEKRIRDTVIRRRTPIRATSKHQMIHREQDLRVEIEPRETEILIKHDETGYSYENLFVTYLHGSKHVEIIDPYIQEPHQIRNLVVFVEMLLSKTTVRKLHLVTKSSKTAKNCDQEGKLNALKKSTEKHGFDFSFEFDQRKHDRSIKADSGWRIKLGRGLDIFQKADFYGIGMCDQTKRKCYTDDGVNV